MDPYYMSLNQVNFDKQTLADGGDEIESFANIVSYDDDFKSSNLFPIESKKVFFEHDNGLYLQQEQLNGLKRDIEYRNDTLNKTGDTYLVSRGSYQNESLPNSFKAFTDITDGLHLQETVISSSNYHENVSADYYPLSSLEYSSSKMNSNMNSTASLKDSRNTTQQAFQLDLHPTSEPIRNKQKTKSNRIVTSQKNDDIKIHNEQKLDSANETSINNLHYDYGNQQLIPLNKDELIIKKVASNFNESSYISESASHNLSNNIENDLLRTKLVGQNLENSIQFKTITNKTEIISNKYIDEWNNVGDTVNLSAIESGGFKSWELERAHLIGQLEMLTTELRLVLTDRSTLKRKVASLEEQLKIFGSTTEDRDALSIDLETLRTNQSRLESVIMEAHALLNERNEEIQQLNATVQLITEERDSFESQLMDSRQVVESREAISIDLKAKITELYIELQLSNQKTAVVDHQVSAVEGDLKGARAARDWFKEQLELTGRDLGELREELTTIRAKHIQRGTELEKCKAELARSKRQVVDTEQRLLSEKQMLVAYLERIESDMMQRDAQLDAANRTYVHVIEKKLEESDVEKKINEIEPEPQDHEALRKLSELEIIKSNLEKRINHYEKICREQDNLEKENTQKIISLDEELNSTRLQLQTKNNNLTDLERKCLSLEADLSHSREEKKFIDQSMLQLKNDLKLIEQNFSSMKDELRKKQLLIEKLTTQVDLLVKELDALKIQKHKSKLAGLDNLVEIPVVTNFNFHNSNFRDSGVQAEPQESNFVDEATVNADKNGQTVNIQEDILVTKHCIETMTVNIEAPSYTPQSINEDYSKISHKYTSLTDTETQTDSNKPELLIFPFSSSSKCSTTSVQTNILSCVDADTQVRQNNVDVLVGSNYPIMEGKDFSSNTELVENKDKISNFKDVNEQSCETNQVSLPSSESRDKMPLIEDAIDIYLIDEMHLQSKANQLKPRPSVADVHINHKVKFVSAESDNNEGPMTSIPVAHVHGSPWTSESERSHKWDKQNTNEQFKLENERLITEAIRCKEEDWNTQLKLILCERDRLSNELDKLAVENQNLKLQIRDLKEDVLRIQMLSSEHHNTQIISNDEICANLRLEIQRITSKCEDIGSERDLLLADMRNLTVTNENLKLEINRLIIDQENLRKEFENLIPNRINEEKAKWDVERLRSVEELTNARARDFSEMQNQFEVRICDLQKERDFLISDRDNIKQMYLNEIQQYTNNISNLNVNLMEYENLATKLGEEKQTSEEMNLKLNLLQSEYNEKVEQLQLEKQDLVRKIDSLKLEFENKYRTEIEATEDRHKHDLNALNIKHATEIGHLNQSITTLKVEINNLHVHNETHFHSIQSDRDSLALELQRTKGMLDGILGSQHMLREHASSLESSLASKESTDIKNYSQILDELRLKTAEANEVADQLRLADETLVKEKKHIAELKKQIVLEKANGAKLKDDFNKLHLHFQQIEAQYIIVCQEKEKLVSELNIHQTLILEKHTTHLVEKVNSSDSSIARDQSSELRMIKKKKVPTATLR